MDNFSDKWSFKSSDLYTIPNILTYVRLILIVPIAINFLLEKYSIAALCLMISALSDCFDGFIARRFNQITSLGKILDPIADKLTLFAIVICMAIKMPVVIPLLIILIFKDILMLTGGVDLMKKGITPPPAKWYGKLGTVVFYLSVCIIVVCKALFNIENNALNYLLLGLSVVVMLFALYKYATLYFEKIREYKNSTLSNVDVISESKNYKN